MVGVAVPLLQGDASLDVLDVAEPRHGFHGDTDVGGPDDRVPRSAVAWDRHGDLRLPPEGRVDASAEPLQEGKLRFIPDWIAHREHAHGEIEAKHGREPTELVDGRAAYQSTLQPANLSVGHTGTVSDPGLAEPGGEACCPQLVADRRDSPSTASMTEIDGTFPCWHGRIVAASHSRSMPRESTRTIGGSTAGEASLRGAAPRPACPLSVQSGKWSGIAGRRAGDCDIRSGDRARVAFRVLPSGRRFARWAFDAGQSPVPARPLERGAISTGLAQ